MTLRDDAVAAGVAYRVRSDRARARRVPRVDARAGLSVVQQQAWDCTAAVRALLCGRRAGKTWWAATWLLAGALAQPNALCVYLALTQKSARWIAWPVIRRVAEALGIAAECLHEQTLTVYLPNGSVLVCAGTDDTRTIETWRGTKLWRAVVDECGSQPNTWLRYLVEDILRPALLDLRGQLALCGTPGLVLRAGQYWYDLTGPERTATVPLYRWTVFDNPSIPHAANDVAAMREEHGWTEETPQYLREWLALWSEDAGALVFPLEVDRNTIDALPDRSRTGVPLTPSGWRYVIGVDCGYTDATAFSVVAGHKLDPRLFVVQTEKRTEMLPRQVAVHLRELLLQYPRAPVVMDTGGLGKPYAEECTRVFRLHVEAAEKREKAGNVRLTRGELRAGRLVVVDGACNDALYDEWAVLGWDADKLLPSDVHEDHATDATLYALRKLRHYREEEAQPEPEVGTAAHLKHQEEAMFRARERAARQARAQRMAGGWR